VCPRPYAGADRYQRTHHHETNGKRNKKCGSIENFGGKFFGLYRLKRPQVDAAPLASPATAPLLEHLAAWPAANLSPQSPSSACLAAMRVASLEHGRE